MNPAKSADRKKQLIVQGAVYRAEIILAKEMTEASLRPDSLAKSILHQAALTAFSAFKNRGGNGLPGLNVQTLLPLVITGVSVLAKRKSLAKSVLRGVLLAGVAAGVVAFISKKSQIVRSVPDRAE
jgi:hypothetical protein